MKTEQAPFDWIVPDWPAPANVRALCTTRSGGFSAGPWSSMNLGPRCGDEAAAVSRNQARLDEYLPASPRWLHQVHGVTVVDEERTRQPGAPDADAIVSGRKSRVCAVLTADCLPVLFCDREGSRVAAAHAGWRGLAAGVLEATVARLGADPADILAWLGPAIGPGAYEVGVEVAEAFPAEFPLGFRAHGDRWMMDLYSLATIKLESLGVQSVSGGGFCTFSDQERFYSYRRDGVTGRMGSMIWME